MDTKEKQQKRNRDYYQRKKMQDAIGYRIIAQCPFCWNNKREKGAVGYTYGSVRYLVHEDCLATWRKAQRFIADDVLKLGLDKRYRLTKNSQEIYDLTVRFFSVIKTIDPNALLTKEPEYLRFVD